jgi:coenzyme F420-reducing hydrogenase gamma subunit
MPPQPQANQKKLIVGWFSFTCCEDSTILFTELLNDHYDQWSKLIEFRHARVLKTKNELKDLDVAFIEGAISGESQEQEVKKIRDNSKYVIAIGACAVTGKPAASRNEFVPQDITDEIQSYFDRFDYTKEVKQLDQIIKVDDAVPGCPMNSETFIQTINKYLKLFKIV